VTREEKKKKHNAKVIIIDLTGKERKKKKHNAEMIIDIDEDDDDIDIDWIGKEDKKIPAKVMIIDVDDVQVNNRSPKKLRLARGSIAAGIGTATSTVKAATNTSSVDCHNSDYQLALKLASKSGGNDNDDDEGQTITSNQYCTSQRKRRNPFECQICLENDLPSFQGYTIDECNHRFYITCLIGLIDSSMTSGSSSSSLLNNTIICPHDKCKTILATNDIRYILRNNPSCWKAYSENANLGVLELEVADKNSNTRRCPSQHCNFIFVFDTPTTTTTTNPSAEGRQFDCPMCKEKFCLQCGANNGKVGPAHTGISCYERNEELKQNNKERRILIQWQKENPKSDERFNSNSSCSNDTVLRHVLGDNSKSIKRCRRCGNGIELASGCLKVKCICGYRFCYNCESENAQCNCTSRHHGYVDNKTGRGDFTGLYGSKSYT